MLLGGAAFAGTGLDAVCASYTKHDYALCLKQLDEMPSASRSAKSEYYRALCFQALHRYEEAQSQFQRLSKQTKDLNIAALSRQGLQSLASRQKFNHGRIASQASNSSPSAPALKSVADSKYVTDSNWKVQDPGFGKVENKEGLPDNWTFVKTSNGCGRHH